MVRLTDYVKRTRCQESDRYGACASAGSGDSTVNLTFMYTFWCILMPPPSFRRTRLEIAGRGSGGARTSTPATLAAVSSPFFKGVAEGRRLPSPMRLGSRPPRRAK